MSTACLVAHSVVGLHVVKAGCDVPFLDAANAAGCGANDEHSRIGKVLDSVLVAVCGVTHDHTRVKKKKRSAWGSIDLPWKSISRRCD